MEKEIVKQKGKSFIRSYLFEGIILAALGIAMLVWPEWSLKVLCVVLGGVIATMGFIRFALFLINQYYKNKALDLVIGIVQMAFGLALIAASDFFISLFFIITGIVLIYGAFLMFLRAFQLRSVGGAMLIMSIVFAVLTLGLAVLIFINPIQFAEIITRIQGAALVIEGIGMIIVLKDMQIKLEYDTKE